MKLPSTYQPKNYESDIYALWEKKGAFEPVDRGGEGYFSEVLPPPNANASLHIGYGLTVAIYDILARYHRMLGKRTLLVPGADHAGIETQAVYEKHLAKEGKSRLDFSREELYKQIWDFVELNKHNFQSQVRALGASADWSRFTYTLDNKVVAQAYQTFKKMWDEGLIYRGERVVNFCTFHGTSFADIEVVHEEEDTKLWHIAYPLKEGRGEVVIATTRPETKMGQAALMVNPNDKRYKHLIGKEVEQPLVPGKPIKIIADSYVDMEFGTGVVTVTPAHDPNDFEVAQRHNLPTVELITPEGKMSDNVPKDFRGLTVMEAREKAEKVLKEKGYLRKVENYRHSVGKCYKCGTVIEPLLREQWFVRMEPLAKKAIDALKNKEIKFHPDSKRTQLIRYLEGLKDWNISRQIAWGIPIPAFQNVDDPKDWIYDTRVHEDVIEVNDKKYKRDTDVFDTWFSSSSWPYVTLDYPNGEDFKQFYPLSLMDTGGEILYPWVSRMIMLGLYETGKIPFKEVYIHGYVMAEDGAKMSKSLGNTIDLTETIEQYGSDALRMGIVLGRIPAVNRPYDSRRIEEARNFSNKLWNIARFIEAKVGDDFRLRSNPDPQTPADHYILNKLSISVTEISKALDGYRLSEAYEFLYHFVWHDLADWYIEASKTEPNLPLLAYMLEATLKLAHPFAPFVTETIWQTLAWEEDTLLAIQKWPEVIKADKQQAKKFEDLTTIVSESRHIISVLNLKKPHLHYQYAEVIVEQVGLLLQLGRLGGVSETKNPGQGGLRLTNTSYAVWIDVDERTAQKYISDLKARQKERMDAVARLKSRLDNKDYASKAPKEIVEQTRAQLEDEQKLLETLDKELSTFIRASRGL